MSLTSRLLPRMLLGIVIICTALAARAAGAAPVVVGSVDPQTMRVTVFKDLLVKKFGDGSAITTLYGKYNPISNGYLFVRNGKLANGSCHTEAFNLIRLSGNRLAIALPDDPHLVWIPGVFPRIKPAFECKSESCSTCYPYDPTKDPMGSPLCICHDTPLPSPNDCGISVTVTFDYGPRQIVGIGG